MEVGQKNDMAHVDRSCQEPIKSSALTGGDYLVIRNNSSALCLLINRSSL